MTSQESWSNIMLANQSFRLPSGVNQYQGRLLALVGHKEYGVMKESARMLANAVRNGEAGEVRLEGKFSLAQSHNWPLNAPEKCADIIRAWVEAKPLPAEVLLFPAVPKNTSV